MLKKNMIFGLLFMSTTAIAAPWKTGIQAYDINGNPYTGKAYINSAFWGEIDFKDGRPIRVLTDACMKGSCEKKEVINGVPYIRSREENGQLLDGMIKTEPKKEGNWTQLGQEGLYSRGVPDALHKESDLNGLTKETMYDKGKTLWEKQYGHIIPLSPYMLLKADMQETIYNDKLVVNNYYKNGQKVLEWKTVPDDRLAEISLYENGKMLMRQRFRKNGTSQVENFIDNTKKDLEENQIYDLTKWSDGWEENEPYNYDLSHGVFHIIAGKRSVCFGVIDDLEATRCLKDINTPSSNVEILSAQQKQLLYENPKEFFAKNELGFDLSDVGEQNLRQLNDKRALMMMAAFQGMAESMNLTQDEMEKNVKKRIDKVLEEEQ